MRPHGTRIRRRHLPQSGGSLRRPANYPRLRTDFKRSQWDRNRVTDNHTQGATARAAQEPRHLATREPSCTIVERRAHHGNWRPPSNPGILPFTAPTPFRGYLAMASLKVAAPEGPVGYADGGDAETERHVVGGRSRSVVAHWP
jgi:hypothetical protein